MARSPLPLLLVPLAFGALGAGLSAPSWVHVLDSGSATLAPSAATADDLPTRQLTLEGKPYGEVFVSETTKREGSQTSSRAFYLPIVDKGAEGVVDVPVLLLTHSVDAAALQEEFSGTLRTALWEGGVDDEVRKLFRDKDVFLAKDVVVLEENARRGDQLTAFGFTAGLFLLGVLSVAGALRRKERPGPDA